MLEEEMRRAIKFCEWRALWWDEQRHGRPNLKPFHLAEGVSAYAAEQAQAECECTICWTARWVEIRKTAGTALAQYLSLDGEPPQTEAIHITIEDDSEDEDFKYEYD